MTSAVKTVLDVFSFLVTPGFLSECLQDYISSVIEPPITSDGRSV
jgi:hypothetical protein